MERVANIEQSGRFPEISWKEAFDRGGNGLPKEINIGTGNLTFKYLGHTNLTHGNNASQFPLYEAIFTPVSISHKFQTNLSLPRRTSSFYYTGSNHGFYFIDPAYLGYSGHNFQIIGIDAYKLEFDPLYKIAIAHEQGHGVITDDNAEINIFQALYKMDRRYLPNYPNILTYAELVASEINDQSQLPWISSQVELQEFIRQNKKFNHIMTLFNERFASGIGLPIGTSIPGFITQEEMPVIMDMIGDFWDSYGRYYDDSRFVYGIAENDSLEVMYNFFSKQF